MGCCISDAYRNLENIIAIGEEEVTFEILYHEEVKYGNHHPLLYR